MRLQLLIAVIIILSGAWYTDGLFVDFRHEKVPFVQRGCDIMYMPDADCSRRPAPFLTGCCTPGYRCQPDRLEGGRVKCLLDRSAATDYSYSNSTGKCKTLVPVAGQCGGTGGDCRLTNNCDNFGPWVGFCCPNGFSCQPRQSNFRIWTCQTDVNDQPKVHSQNELLRYPPAPLPADACTCRQGFDKQRVPMACPSAWDHAAGTSQVPPALEFAPGGRLQLVTTKEDAVLRGVNFFGWNVGSYNFDGLWAFCDDNVTYSSPPCKQDGDIPPGDFPSPAVGVDAQMRLNTSYWGKRSMTNDFAMVVYRMKLLGLNAVRVPFRFDQLNEELPGPTPDKPSEFFTCMRDSPSYVGGVKTLDPELIRGLSNYSEDIIRPLLPPYKGMQHPPPRDLFQIRKPGSPAPVGKSTCGGIWEVPFLSNYTGGRGRTFNMTMCNWYLPQGKGTAAIHRFLWQIQYFVSQGFYVILDYNNNVEFDSNMKDPKLLADNWGNLWKMMTALPHWKYMRGRVFPDLVNEASRWGCQWDRECQSSNGTLACKPAIQLFGTALNAIWTEDPKTPVFLNGLGQDNSTKWKQCGSYYPGMHWGDGFITNKRVLQSYQLSDPSALFSTGIFKRLGFLPISVQTAAPQSLQVGLAPHVYPRSITTAQSEDVPNELTRWELSWGLKFRGADRLSDSKTMAETPVLIGEFGVKDMGNNADTNADTTVYTPDDRYWLQQFAQYSRDLSAKAGRPVSWFWWAWNANSGDTQGLVGPKTTWREVQWTKVRMLVREYGLQPWYCAWWPDFCNDLTW